MANPKQDIQRKGRKTPAKAGTERRQHMGKWLLIDGHNLLFQMFFGMPARIVSRDGKAMQGTLGFVGATLRMIRMTEPTHVLAVFDGEHENPRRELDPEYKSGRVDYSAVPEEESPFSQLPDIYRALDQMGICHTETVACEADDLIASYIRRLPADASAVIASFDSDFFQLVSKRVSVLRYRGKDNIVLLDEQGVQARFGVPPKQYADFKALTGDKADSIVGVRDVGPRTAASLLASFGNIEGIIAHTEEIHRFVVRRSVSQSAELMRRNRSLIRLLGEEPLPVSPENMTYTPKPDTTFDVMRAIGLY